MGSGITSPTPVMIDERRETQASLYVLGALPADEQREFERAMLSDLELQLLVRDLRGTNPRIPGAPARYVDIQPAAPPVAEEPGASRTDWLVWVPWGLAAAFALLNVILLSFGSGLRRENNDLAQRLAETELAYADLQHQQTNLQQKLVRVETNYVGRIADLQKQVRQKTQDYERQKIELETRGAEATQARKQMTGLQNQLAQNAIELERLNAETAGVNSLNQDHTSQSRLGLLTPTPDGPSAAIAAASYDTIEQKGVLVIDNLAPLPPDRDYQLWLLDPSFGAPVSGGVFRLPDRRGRIEYRAAAQVRSPERFAISVERRGGSAAPQGRFILTSN
jgi:anti-sigma-K factor RskA